MLDKMDLKYGDVVSNVCHAATLKRFWNLKSKIQNFMKEKGQDVTFLIRDF